MKRVSTSRLQLGALAQSTAATDDDSAQSPILSPVLSPGDECDESMMSASPPFVANQDAAVGYLQFVVTANDGSSDVGVGAAGVKLVEGAGGGGGGGEGGNGTAGVEREGGRVILGCDISGKGTAEGFGERKERIIEVRKEGNEGERRDVGFAIKDPSKTSLAVPDSVMAELACDLSSTVRLHGENSETVRACCVQFRKAMKMAQAFFQPLVSGSLCKSFFPHVARYMYVCLSVTYFFMRTHT